MTSQAKLDRPGAEESVVVALIDDRGAEEIADLRTFMLDECGCRLDLYTEFNALKEALMEGRVDGVMVNYNFRKTRGGQVLRKIKDMEFDQIPMAMFNTDPSNNNEAKLLYNSMYFINSTFIDDISLIHKQDMALRHTFRRQAEIRSVGSPPSIFLIHGRDVAVPHGEGGQRPKVSALERIGKLLEHNLQVRTRIIKEDHVDGTTLIQAIERAIGKSSLAIVLFTADDLGGLRTARCDQFELRARQNVLFEAGLARGVLGRERTVLFKDRDVVLPSDFGGLHPFTLEEYDDTQLAMKLAQILGALGIPFQLRI